ncbi:hypothetical protein CCACVL1_19905, partial [Corchorus capsularis]
RVAAIAVDKNSETHHFNDAER